LEYGIVQILPVRPDPRRCTSGATDDELRQSEFVCRWTGAPAILRDIILARVDWGPFDVSCCRSREYDDRCLCTVHYRGPLRERPHLMASFWHVMERFPFYHERLRQPGVGVAQG
jgi:hypothetical protein